MKFSSRLLLWEIFGHIEYKINLCLVMVQQIHAIFTVNTFALMKTN